MAKDTAHVYRHIRLDRNEPFYIGIASSIKRAHSKKGRNNIWNRVASKTEYTVEILFYDMPRELACSKEIEFIKLYGKICNNTGTLANITDGGDGALGAIQTEEAKEKRSKKLKGVPLSYEHRLKISNAHKGKKIDPAHNQKLQNGRKKNIKLIMNKSVEVNNKPVIDLDTNIIYKSATEAASSLGINRSTMYCYLCGVNKKRKNFKYV
jgi:hypothetical protein